MINFLKKLTQRNKFKVKAKDFGNEWDFTSTGQWQPTHEVKTEHDKYLEYQSQMAADWHLTVKEEELKRDADDDGRLPIRKTFGMSAKRSVERTNRQFVMTMSLCYETDKEHEYKICHFVGTQIKRGRNGVKPEYAEIFTDLTDDLSGVEERMAEWGQHMEFEFKHPQAKKFIKRKKKTGEKKK